MNKIAIIGDGGWGAAMALILERAGNEVMVWGRDPEYLEEMRGTRRNRLYLPGAVYPDRIVFEPDLRQALSWADLPIVAVPSKFLRSTLRDAAGAVRPGVTVLSLTKGFDPETAERPTQVIRDCLETERTAALSGPSHAEEVASFLPASVVVASDELETARRIQKVVSSPRFRAYASPDVVGVEVAGAVKNVIALAAGVVHGLGLGDNAMAALATRGLAEMTRLGIAMGGDPGTFAGLAGMGDLFTTCVSPHGRNRRVGELLAKGMCLDDVLAGMNGVPESVTTTGIVMRLADRHHVEMPIARQVAAILWEAKRPEDALDDLMNRAGKDEY